MRILDVTDAIVADLSPDAIGLDMAQDALARATIDVLKLKAPDQAAYLAAVDHIIILLTVSKEECR